MILAEIEPMPPRPNLALSLLLPLALTAGLGGCGSSASKTDGAPESGSDGSDAGPADGPTGMTCQAIRVCLAVGQSLEVCIARGTPAAQATFNTLLGCLMAKPMPACSGTDPGCTCPEECYADGLCLDQTAACLDASGATADGVCDQYCGG